ncbi:MAG: nickel pincer cofactor biosynthesis protein LarC [SAR202 cluster bacterium]|nr:nickel pincer cofactor biosynthesis protein LarC [SAR202 cluster bacterium]|tara:strand:- start:79295 stop:80506 length:1212 start_codon:yes stop_codon:yes gene_type:complete
MKVAYLQTIGGISGDMFLASLMHVGVDVTRLNYDLNQLGVGRIKITSKQNSHIGFSGLISKIEYENHNWKARNFQDFISIVEKSTLSNNVKRKSIEIFQNLEIAENVAHKGQGSKFHLHELGTLDTLIDVVGVILSFEQLGITQVFSGALPINSGTISTKHGLMPATSPATSALLTQSNAPVFQPDLPEAILNSIGEIITPTGTAILTTIATFEKPLITAEKFGYGFGHKQVNGYLNLLTTWIGSVNPDSRKQLLLIETNIDNMSSEIIGFIQERLFAIGVNDVWTTPIYMKKNRPGIILSVLLDKDLESQVIEMIYNETTTLGLRMQTVLRDQLIREILPIESEFGKIDVKLKYFENKLVSFHPEYEDCKIAANKFNKPYQYIYDSVLKQAKEFFKNNYNLS